MMNLYSRVYNGVIHPCSSLLREGVNKNTPADQRPPCYYKNDFVPKSYFQQFYKDNENLDNDYNALMV